MNHARVEQIIRDLLLELGEDPTREGLQATPVRTADLLQAFAVKRPQAAPPAVATASLAGMGAMTVQTFAFVSLCEHHLLPFFGRVHIGCILRLRECAPTYFEHVVATYAHQPQLQERMTEQIADALMMAVEPNGIGVAAEGRHMCMMMRGVEKQNSEIRSSTLRGCFYQAAIRRSFFARVMTAAPP